MLQQSRYILAGFSLYKHLASLHVDACMTGILDENVVALALLLPVSLLASRQRLESYLPRIIPGPHSSNAPYDSPLSLSPLLGAAYSPGLPPQLLRLHSPPGVQQDAAEAPVLYCLLLSYYPRLMDLS